MKENKKINKEHTKTVKGSLQTEITHGKLKPGKMIDSQSYMQFKVKTEKDLYMELVIQPQLNTIAIYKKSSMILTFIFKLKCLENIQQK